MRKLYYISKTNQKLKQIEYLSPKSIVIYVLVALFLLGVSWALVSILTSFTSSGKSVSSLENENNFLKEKLKSLTAQYKNFDKNLSDLRTENNYLRLAANLPPLSNDELNLGVGGNEFESGLATKIKSLQDLDDLSKYVSELELTLKFEKSEHQKISSRLKQNKILYASIPAIKPCAGILGQNGFGMREHPILGINKMHEGIDIITDYGTKVVTPGNGTVTFTGFRGGYGLTVEIEHSNGYKTIFAHLSRLLVTERQKVTRGKIIALTGNSGLSTGPHLHYEVHHDGIKLDPAQFFFDDLVLFEK